MQYRELSDQELAKVLGGVSTSSTVTSTSIAPHGSSLPAKTASTPVFHVATVTALPRSVGKLLTLPSL